MTSRRHETTIDGVTAWAGEWHKDQHTGDASCLVPDDSDLPNSLGDVMVVAYPGYFWIQDETEGRHRGAAFALVLSRVLAEAAQIAQGGDPVAEDATGSNDAWTMRRAYQEGWFARDGRKAALLPDALRAQEADWEASATREIAQGGEVPE